MLNKLFYRWVYLQKPDLCNFLMLSWKLYYQFDSSCGCSKKSIECQSDIDIYKDCDFVENYGYILKISLETENNKCMIYK